MGDRIKINFHEYMAKIRQIQEKPVEERTKQDRELLETFQDGPSYRSIFGSKDK